MRVSGTCLIGCAAIAFAVSMPAAFAASTTAASPTAVTSLPAGTLPEDIVPVPAGFGGLGGTYLVNNATGGFVGPGEVFDIPAGGGPATVFANVSPLQPIGGVFLPSNYGALAGQYLAAGNTLGANGVSDVAAISSAGTMTQIAQAIGSNILADVAIAPAGFDSVGGQVILASEGGDVLNMTPNRTFSVLPGGNVLGAQPYGLSFAPSGFGAVGGDLLISDSASPNIYALSPSGALSLFATVPFAPGQVGLRQMAFAPAGFGAYGGDLLVSVSGSNAGGGIAGSVDVLNGSGQTIAYLAQGVSGAPYDPRGLVFPDSTDLWVADADPSIFSATSADFTPGSPARSVPEPASLVLFSSGLFGLGLARYRKHKGS